MARGASVTRPFPVQRHAPAQTWRVRDASGIMERIATGVVSVVPPGEVHAASPFSFD